MRVTFVCPSSPTPMGGVTTLYEFANGLARRGNEVQVVHGAFWGRESVASVEEIGWFRFEPSIVHSFHGDGEAIEVPAADVIFGTGADRALGLPVLLVQGLDMFPAELEREVFRTPCLKVCIASWLAEAMDRFGVPPAQVVHVSQGIDHHLFRVTERPERRAPVVGLLHHRHPAKGWIIGLRAVELAHESVPGLRAVAFGTSVPDESLPDWMDFHLSPEPAAVVTDVYNRCQVFVQPSQFEGFGFTAVEAMACGAALVTTDNGGSRDYAVDGETALVTPPADVEGLAAAVAALLGDDDRRLRMAEAGRQWVQQFDWDRAAAVLEGHLEAYVRDPDHYREPPLEAAG